MENSPRLKLPYIMPSQAQKHVTHNEAIRALDTLTQICFESVALINPPSEPNEGDTFFIGGAPTGEWSEKANMIATFQDGAWAYHAPIDGALAWDKSTNHLLVWNTTEWKNAAIPQTLGNLGINAEADLTNRLTVSAETTLLNHEGNGHQLKINKASFNQTASLLFQNNFSSKGEFGICGNDAISLKTSPDGYNWKTAIIANQNSAEVSFPKTPHLASPLLFNSFGDGGRFLGSPERQSLTGNTFQIPSYLLPYNGTLITQGPKFIHNNSTFGGSGSQLDPDIADLAQKIRPNATNTLSYGPEFFTLDVTAGVQQNSPATHSGTSYYPSLLSQPLPILQNITLNYWVKVKVGEALLVPSSENELFIDGIRKTLPQTLTVNDGWKQITRRVSYDLPHFYGYETNLTKMYFEVSSNYLLALPALFSGHIPINPQSPHGPVPSMHLWS